MKTINDILTPKDGALGRWSLWANDVVAQLDTLRATPKTKIDVQYTPVEYWSDGAVDGSLWWECAHKSTTPDVIEHYDHYAEAVTGLPQGLTYENIDACDACDAYYSHITEEWYNEQ